MNGLLNFWPTLKSINDCIMTDAEAASDAVLMAAHQPVPLVTQVVGSPEEEDAKEIDLLNTLLDPNNTPEGYLLIPVSGASGVGKSHVVRWLAAQLTRDPRAKRMHVIRVPKHANLRQVVELILKPLKGDGRYSKASDDLQRSMQEVSADEAAVFLSANLKILLEEKYSSLLQQIKNSDQPSRDDQLRASHAKGLPQLFDDAIFQEHFRIIFEDLIKRASSGVVEDAGILPQFDESHLQVPIDLENKIGQASRPVQAYYQTNLNRRPEIALELLNEVLDEAISRVFNLNESVGGLTLEDLMLRIRELLHEDDKELILLVEDFSQLAGIEEVLLRICTALPKEDGPNLAPMRTVLALTDGFFDRYIKRSTILTRMKKEWRVKSFIGDNGHDFAINLVASYLNAARWGKSYLEDRFQNDLTIEDLESRSWVPVFGEDPEGSSKTSTEMLEAFGRNDDGIELFPLSRNSIRMLSKKHGVSDAELTPRFLINNVIREVLTLRSQFDLKSFPPRSLGLPRLNAEIDSWMSRVTMEDSEIDRYRTLIGYWGANPRDESELGSIPKGIFEAFGLRALDEFAELPEPVDPIPGVAPPTPTPVDPAAEKVEVWKSKLEDWVKGGTLAQSDANLIRKHLKPALVNRVEWNSIFCSQDEGISIDLPNARGANGNISVMDDPKDKKGFYRNAFVSLYRFFELNKQSFDYDESFIDVIRIENYLDSLKDRVEITKRKEAKEMAKLLSSVLHRQGWILGVGEKNSKTSIADRQRMLGVVDAAHFQQTDASIAELSNWYELIEQTVVSREKFRKRLFDVAGCFQGTGAKIYGVDSVRISTKFTESDIAKLRELTREEAAYLSSLTEVRLKARLTKNFESIQSYLSVLESTFELKSKEIEQFVELFPELMTELEEIAAWPSGFDKGRLMDLMDKLVLVDWVSAIENMSQIAKETNTLDHKLWHLARMNHQNLPIILEFLQTIPRFLKKSEEAIEVKELGSSDLDLKKNIDGMKDQLTSLVENFHELQGEAAP